jgi:UDP-N-acetylglucosamine 2-epimerase
VPDLAVVLGTRPELTKLSPLIARLPRRLTFSLIHTGQHYSYEMDRIFFEELALPEPDHQLGVGSGSHGAQTGAMLAAIERILLADRPRAVVVQGDTNTALAGALAAAKQHVPVVHLEAGARSWNRAMPEEINRVLVDQCADLNLAPTEEAVANLRREGVPESTIRLIGSTSVDACRLHAPRAAARRPGLLGRLGISGDYAFATVHRAENTRPEVLPGIYGALAELSRDLPIVLALHPRTRGSGVPLPDEPALHVVDPLGYLDALALVGGARLILTDSGGLQEEAPALGTPAVVMRRDTEWADLVGPTGNVLAGNDRDGIVRAAHEVLARASGRVDVPWIEARVGAGERAVAEIERLLAA